MYADRSGARNAVQVRGKVKFRVDSGAAECLQRCNKTHKLVWAGDVHKTGLCYVREHNKRKRSQFYSCSIVIDRSVNHLFSQAKNQIKLTISETKFKRLCDLQRPVMTMMCCDAA